MTNFLATNDAVIQKKINSNKSINTGQRKISEIDVRKIEVIVIKKISF